VSSLIRCQSTLKKAKVQSHSWQCSSRSFSCIDCGVSFTPQSYNSHTQCVSEAEKYQGKLYKGKKHQPNSQQPQQPQQPQQQPSGSTAVGQKRAAEERKEADGDSSEVQQQQPSKKSKQQQQTTAEAEETKEQSTEEQPLAELLPALLQGEVRHSHKHHCSRHCTHPICASCSTASADIASLCAMWRACPSLFSPVERSWVEAAEQAGQEAQADTRQAGSGGGAVGRPAAAQEAAHIQLDTEAIE